MAVTDLGQTGSFTPPTAVENIRWQSVQVRNQPAKFDVTGEGDSNRQYLNGINIAELICDGVVRDDNSGGAGLSQNCNLPQSIMNITPVTWALRKTWPLFDVTGDGLTERGWVSGIPTLSLAITEAFVSSGGPDSYDANLTTMINLKFDQVGNFLSEVVYFDEFSLTQSHRDGGPVPVRIRGTFGGYATTDFFGGTYGDNFNWLFKATNDYPANGTTVVQIGTVGDAITSPTVVYDVTIQALRGSGGHMPVRARMRLGTFEAA